MLLPSVYEVSLEEEQTDVNELDGRDDLESDLQASYPEPSNKSNTKNKDLGIQEEERISLAKPLDLDKNKQLTRNQAMMPRQEKSYSINNQTKHNTQQKPSQVSMSSNGQSMPLTSIASTNHQSMPLTSIASSNHQSMPLIPWNSPFRPGLPRLTGQSRAFQSLNQSPRNGIVITEVTDNVIAEPLNTSDDKKKNKNKAILTTNAQSGRSLSPMVRLHESAVHGPSMSPQSIIDQLEDAYYLTFRPN